MLDQKQFAEIKAGGRLPSPTATALKFIELIQSDEVALPDLVRVLQTDPAIVGRLLQLANSAAYARPRPAAALSADVLMTLGLPAVRQIVLSFSLIDANRKGSCASFDYEAFWSRSLATAAALQSIGTALRLAPAAELFTLGLLSRAGQLALASLDPAAYAELGNLAEQAEPAALVGRETDLFGYSHVEVGSALLASWGLPKLFVDAVEMQDEADPLVRQPEARVERLASALWLASQLAGMYFLDEATAPAAMDKLRSAAQALDLVREDPEAQFAALLVSMFEAWREWGDLMGIAVKSRPLPDPKAADTPPATTPVSAAIDTPPMRILVVDDDSTLCRLLQKQLQGVGHVVKLAHNGQDGLRLALDERPDMIITDLTMPQKDGFALIRALRQTDFGRHIYIVVLTVANDESNLTLALDSGADDFITKPIQPRTLHARLRAGLRIVREQRRLRDEVDRMQRKNLELAMALRQIGSSAPRRTP